MPNVEEMKTQLDEFKLDIEAFSKQLDRIEKTFAEKLNDIEKTFTKKLETLDSNITDIQTRLNDHDDRLTKIEVRLDKIEGILEKYVASDSDTIRKIFEIVSKSSS